MGQRKGVADDKGSQSGMQEDRQDTYILTYKHALGRQETGWQGNEEAVMGEGSWRGREGVEREREAESLHMGIHWPE